MEIIFFLVIWLIFGGICALIAESRNRDRTTWLILGFIFGIFALVAILVMPKGEHGRKTCPDCAETVLAAATICKHCGHQFPSREEENAARLRMAESIDTETAARTSDRLKCPECGCGPPNVELLEGGQIFCHPEEKVTGLYAPAT